MSAHEVTAVEHGHALGAEVAWVVCSCGWIGFASASERLAREHHTQHAEANIQRRQTR